MRHDVKVGATVMLIEGPFGIYEGTDGRFGIVVAHTEDAGTPIYSVEFEDGNSEPFLYRDEFVLAYEYGSVPGVND